MPATRRSQSHHDSTVGNATVKKITVFRNGDAVHGSIQMVVNNRQIRDMNILLENISQRIGLINGAKKLYTTSGVLIKSIGDLQDGHSYVASSNHYTPLPYGGVNKKSKKPKIHKEEENHQPLVDEETQTKKKKKKIHKKEVEAVEKLEKQEKPEKKARSSSRKAEEKKKSEIEDDVISERLGRVVHIPTSDDDAVSKEVELPSGDETEEEDPETVAISREVASRRASLAAATSPSSRRKSHPNWGDLSSFTKNIESLLRK